MAINAWTVVLAVVAGLAAAGASAEPVSGAEVWAYAGMLPPSGHGGEGQRDASWQIQDGPIDVGTPIVYFTQWAAAGAAASAQTETLRAWSMGAVTLWPMCDPCSASTPFAISGARWWDTRVFGGGPPGEHVLIDVTVELHGQVTLHGTPSGGSEWLYTAYVGPSFGASSDNLFALSASSGGLLPPLVTEVGPMTWTQRIDIELGKPYRVYTTMLSHVGDSGFYGFGLGHYENSIDLGNTGTLHMRAVPGYEYVTMVSAAGAQLLPVPEPTSGLLMLLGLAGTLAAARSRRRDVGSS
jgi:hypothetical protein